MGIRHLYWILTGPSYVMQVRIKITCDSRPDHSVAVPMVDPDSGGPPHHHPHHPQLAVLGKGFGDNEKTKTPIKWLVVLK
jgi:hypothetical protein